MISCAATDTFDRNIVWPFIEFGSGSGEKFFLAGFLMLSFICITYISKKSMAATWSLKKITNTSKLIYNLYLLFSRTIFLNCLRKSNGNFMLKLLIFFQLFNWLSALIWNIMLLQVVNKVAKSSNAIKSSDLIYFQSFSRCRYFWAIINSVP